MPNSTRVSDSEYLISEVSPESGSSYVGPPTTSHSAMARALAKLPPLKSSSIVSFAPASR